MHKLHLPFKRSVYRLMSTVLVLLYFIWKGLIMGITEQASSYQDVIVYFLLGFILILTLVVLDLFTLVFKDDELVKVISFKDEFSFNIREDRINRRHHSIEKIVDKRIHWKTIKGIEVGDDFEGISIRLETGDLIKIQDDYENFYLLLTRFPDYISFDRQSYAKFLADLETCPVCGMIAKYKTRCCSCFTQFPENNTITEEQIRDAQLFYFILQMDDNRNVDFFEERNNGFVRTPNWKPLIEKQDLINFLDDRSN